MSGLRNQPLGSAQIDWSNPITRGLLGAGYGREGINLVTGQRSSQNTASVVAGQHGLGRRYTYTGGPVGTTRDIYQNINPQQFTLICLTRQTQNAAIQGVIGSQDPGVSSASGFSVKPNSSNQIRALVIDSGGQKTAIGGTITLNTWYMVGATSDGATASIWRNGIKEASVSHGTIVYNGTHQLSIGACGNSDYGGDNALWLYFERGVTDAEMRSLHANPWQVFKAPERSLYFSAGGGGVSGTFSSTLASLVAAASGSPVVSGSSVTTLSNVTSAFTSSSTISGQLDTTLSNATPALTGSSVVSGQINTTLSDAAVAGSGTTTVIGTIVATLEDLAAAFYEAGSSVLTNLYVTMVKVFGRMGGR